MSHDVMGAAHVEEKRRRTTAASIVLSGVRNENRILKSIFPSVLKSVITTASRSRTLAVGFSSDKSDPSLGSVMDPAPPLSAYERRRAANMVRNKLKMRELGLPATAPTKKKKAAARRPKRKRPPPTEGVRRSRRANDLPPATAASSSSSSSSYTPQNDDDDRRVARGKREEEIAKGWRDAKDGAWRGERFGAVAGIPEGYVFGKGDYQRKGRFEMSATGFFVPRVTPEWIDNATKEAFAIVVNNDNGLSRDTSATGDVIVYAGAGGRRRGQNRTAEQSFHQTWDSGTNAALRGNCRSGRPVRVVRGPKCASKHGTGSTGGGYRYDGLFSVETAELVASGKRGLRTALFTLRKVDSPPSSA